jgi:type II secretion system protein H
MWITRTDPREPIRGKCKRFAFTLVEMLLVLAILAIVSAIVLPSFAKSMGGNRLRTATRTIVKAGRYARSIAVLKQAPITLVFDMDGSSISVVGGDDRDNIFRKLDRVSIASVRTGEIDERSEGSYRIVYQTNGRCLPYEVTLVDSDGSIAEIKVDALATAETESDEE